jgi:hypothetical protein
MKNKSMLMAALFATFSTAALAQQSVTLPNNQFPAYNKIQPTPFASTVGDGVVTSGATAAAVSAAGTGYAPNDTQLLTDGAPTYHGVLTIATTKAVSATIANAGSGGTNGATTCTGTTGTGTKFQVTLTVVGNALNGTLTVSVPGSYTVNPLVLTNEPVSCAPTVNNASVNVVMGAATATVLIPGGVTSIPGNPVAGTAVIGVGTGATWTMTYGVVAQTLPLSPANGWKFYNSSTHDMWITDNGVTPTVNGPSSMKVPSLTEVHSNPTEDPPGSALKLLGNTMGDPFIARSW